MARVHMTSRPSAENPAIPVPMKASLSGRLPREGDSQLSSVFVTGTSSADASRPLAKSIPIARIPITRLATTATDWVAETRAAVERGHQQLLAEREEGHSKALDAANAKAEAARQELADERAPWMRNLWHHTQGMYPQARDAMREGLQ